MREFRHIFSKQMQKVKKTAKNMLCNERKSQILEESLKKMSKITEMIARRIFKLDTTYQFKLFKGQHN